MKIIKGTSNRYLDINLSDQSWTVYKVSQNDLRNFMGGKGLALKIFSDRFPGNELKAIDPLGEDNLLIFSMGVYHVNTAPLLSRTNAGSF